MSEPIDIQGENLEEKNHALEVDDEEQDNFLLNFDPEEGVIDKDDDDGTVVLKKDDWEKLTKGVNDIKTTIAQKKHWKKKATSINSSSIKPMSNNESNKEAVVTPPVSVSTEKAVEPTPAPAAPTKDLEKDVEIIKLTTKHPYLINVAEKIVSTARQLNKTPEEALEDELLKPFVEQQRKDYDISHASMTSSSSGSPVSTGEVKDWSQASKEDVIAKNKEVARRR